MSDQKTGAKIVADFFAAFRRRDLDAVAAAFRTDGSWMLAVDETTVRTSD